MRRRNCARGTSGASRALDTAEIQSDNERLSLTFGERDVGRVGDAAGAVTIDARGGNTFENALLQAIAKRGEMRMPRGEFAARDFRRFAKADDSRNNFGARTAVALIASAAQHGLERRAFANIQDADALWAADFVRGKRKQVRADSFHIDRDFADGLNRVGVETNLSLARDFADFLDGLNRAKLIVRVHDGYENPLRTNRAADIFGIDDASA